MIRRLIHQTLDAVEANAKADVKRATIRLMDLEREGLGETFEAQAFRLSMARARFRLTLIGRPDNGG